MKKAFKSSVVLTFCLCIIMSTIMMASAISNVKNAKATSITYNSATLTWSKVKNADGYEIQQYSSKKWKTIKTITSGSTVKYKISKLTAGKTYKYRIRAYDKGLIRTTYSDYTKTISVKPVPTQVKGLKATGTNTTSIKLTWTKVSGASGYAVQQYVSKKWKTVKNVTKNTYTVTKLSLGKTYKFRVRAYTTVSKKKVYGSYSSTVSGKTLVPTVGTVKSKSISASAGTVYWGASKDAKGYQVYNPTTKKWVNTKTTRSYTAKSLKAATKYTFKVRAYSKPGKKYYYSAEKSISFTTAPAQVTGAKLSSITQNSMKVSWSKVSGAKGYQVYLYDYGTKKWTNYKTLTGTSVTISGLKAVSQYGVRVRAYVVNGTSNTYGSWCTTLKTYTAPTTPGSVSFSDIKTNAVTVKWSAVSGASGYEIYNPKTKKWVDAKTATSYTVSSLSTGTKYTVKVRAYKTSGSTKLYGTAKEASVTTAPAQVKGLKVSSITKNSFTAAWTAVNGATGYRVDLYKDGTKQSTSYTSKVSMAFSKLTPGAKYKVYVWAYVQNASKSYGTKSTIETITAPNTPSGVKYKDATSSAITIYWNAVSEAAGYQIYDPVSEIWINTNTATSYTFSSLEAGTKYDFQVRAYTTLSSAYSYSTAAKYSVYTAPAQVQLYTPDTYSKSFLISWPEVTGATGYEVQKKDSGEWTSFKTLTETSFKETSVSKNTPYEYRVRAYVKNPLGNSYGSWNSITHSTMNVSSGSEATADSTHIIWDAVNGATHYIIERYEYNNRPYEWVIINGTEIVTETSFKENVKTSNSQENVFGGLYRVSAYDGATYLGSGITEATTTGLTIIKTNGSVTVDWDDVEGVTSYIVKSRAPQNKKSLYASTAFDIDKYANIDKSASSYTFNLAPNENYTYQIWANSDILVAEFSVHTDDLVIDTSNESKNTQAVALVNAINKTKLQKDRVVVSADTTMKTEISKIFAESDNFIVTGLLLGVFGPDYSLEGDEIDEFFKEEGGDAGVSGRVVSESSKQTLTFNSGRAPYVDANGNTRVAQLLNYVEPSETSDRLSYLLNQHSSTIANSAFSSITSTNNADGGYTIVAKLKKETFGTSVGKSNPDYHPGFISSIDMMTTGLGSDAEIRTANIGATTIKAVVNPDNTLSSLEIDSPFTATAALTMKFIEENDTVMGMDLSGTIKLIYNFTK